MKLVSSKEIISRVYRNLNLNEDIRFNDVYEWIMEVIHLINVPISNNFELREIEIKNYKGELPCDLNKIVMLSIEGYGLKYKPNQYYYSYAITKDESQYPTNIQYTYDVRFPYIHTNFEEGIILLEYTKLNLDEDGYPLVPDIESVKQAIFWYTLKMMILGGFTPKAKGITFMFCESQVSHYIGQAKSQMRFPSIAEMENIGNERNKKIPMTNRYATAFRNLGNKEQLNRSGRFKNYPRNLRGFTDNYNVRPK